MLNKEIADALCSAIAMGFVIENNEAKPGTNKTTFIYEKKVDEEKHNRIVGLFAGFGIPLQIEKQTERLPQLIVAKDKKFDQTGFGDEIIYDIMDLEVRINRAKKEGISLNGAYIGGAYDPDTKIIRFYAPSLLNAYKAKYRTDDASVRQSFVTSKEVTAFLKKNLPSKTAHNHDIIKCATMRDEVSAEGLNAGEIYGSQHGMIVAMCEGKPDRGYFVELALSEDTNKVASCIPCSIFMSANEHAANYTHFGRGDNWNLPETRNTTLITQWQNKIKSCYNAFKKTGITNPKLGGMVRYINAKGEGKLPEIFLEALTFESSFIDKITNTLS